ncbi:hypothetical protein BT69DRAFT_1287830 [Atractiella rhizophila]|nr:hypothetical protein BT69DRAFT_1287830 [Atractiella rhizophila]
MKVSTPLLISTLAFTSTTLAAPTPSPIASPNPSADDFEFVKSPRSHDARFLGIGYRRPGVQKNARSVSAVERKSSKEVKNKKRQVSAGANTQAPASPVGLPFDALNGLGLGSPLGAGPGSVINGVAGGIGGEQGLLQGLTGVSIGGTLNGLPILGGTLQSVTGTLNGLPLVSTLGLGLGDAPRSLGQTLDGLPLAGPLLQGLTKPAGDLGSSLPVLGGVISGLGFGSDPVQSGGVPNLANVVKNLPGPLQAVFNALPPSAQAQLSALPTDQLTMVLGRLQAQTGSLTGVAGGAAQSLPVGTVAGVVGGAAQNLPVNTVAGVVNAAAHSLSANTVTGAAGSLPQAFPVDTAKGLAASAPQMLPTNAVTGAAFGASQQVPVDTAKGAAGDKVSQVKSQLDPKLQTVFSSLPGPVQEKLALLPIDQVKAILSTLPLPVNPGSQLPSPNALLNAPDAVNDVATDKIDSVKSQLDPKLQTIFSALPPDVQAKLSLLPINQVSGFLAGMKDGVMGWEGGAVGDAGSVAGIMEGQAGQVIGKGQSVGGFVTGNAPVDVSTIQQLFGAAGIPLSSLPPSLLSQLAQTGSQQQPQQVPSSLLAQAHQLADGPHLAGTVADALSGVLNGLPAPLPAVGGIVSGVAGAVDGVLDPVLSGLAPPKAFLDADGTMNDNSTATTSTMEKGGIANATSSSIPPASTGVAASGGAMAFLDVAQSSSASVSQSTVSPSSDPTGSWVAMGPKATAQAFIDDLEDSEISSSSAPTEETSSSSSSATPSISISSAASSTPVTPDGTTFAQWQNEGEPQPPAASSSSAGSTPVASAPPAPVEENPKTKRGAVVGIQIRPPLNRRLARKSFSPRPDAEEYEFKRRTLEDIDEE